MNDVPDNVRIRSGLCCENLALAHTDFMVGRIDYLVQDLVKRHQDRLITTTKRAKKRQDEYNFWIRYERSVRRA